MKRSHPHTLSNAGFTLVELIVAMSVFIVVLMIASDTFKNIVNLSSKYSKNEESNIEGVIGLEVMRHDLEQMGFGLPWGFAYRDTTVSTSDLVAGTLSYHEATDSFGLSFNDAPGGVPRAFVGAPNFGSAPTKDYFCVKGTTVGRTTASQRWTYIPYHNYSTSTGKESRPVTFPSNNLRANDKVILVSSNFNKSDFDHMLIRDPANNAAFNINFNTTGGIVDEYLPMTDMYLYNVYGVDGTWMPFNRSDFFIKDPGSTLPPFCAPGSGVLYKATVDNPASGSGGGAYNFIPLLDCVLDMKVTLGWDSSDYGSANKIDTYSNIDGSSASGSANSSAVQGWLTNARDIRDHLKLVKVYIIAQDGKIDPNYNAPTPLFLSSDFTDGGFSHASPVLTTAQKKYRWKLYRVIVRPKNLSSNQH